MPGRWVKVPGPLKKVRAGATDCRHQKETGVRFLLLSASDRAPWEAKANGWSWGLCARRLRGTSSPRGIECSPWDVGPAAVSLGKVAEGRRAMPGSRGDRK